MTTTELNNKIYDLNNTWHELTATNDAAIETKNLLIDSLLTDKIDKMNTSIDKQQLEIDKIKASIARSGGEGVLQYESNSEMEYKRAFCNYLRKGGDAALANLEYKNLSDNSGDLGYSITTKMSQQMQKLLLNNSAMRKIANITEISTDVLELIEDRTTVSAGWSQYEEKILEGNPALIPSKKVIQVHELYAQPKVTQKLLDDPRIDVEEWLTQKLIDVFARQENAAFINGDGKGKPRGLLTYPSGNEWGTIEQIATATKGKVSADDIIALFFSLKDEYATNAKFLMSRTAVQAIRMLKDEKSGRYLWQPGIDSSMPNTILGVEVVTSPDMPHIQEGSLSIAFADFRRAYQVVDRPGVRILRDPYTGKPYVKYYSVKRVGGDVVNFDAVKLLRF